MWTINTPCTTHSKTSEQINLWVWAGYYTVHYSCQNFHSKNTSLIMPNSIIKNQVKRSQKAFLLYMVTHATNRYQYYFLYLLKPYYSHEGFNLYSLYYYQIYKESKLKCTIYEYSCVISGSIISMLMLSNNIFLIWFNFVLIMCRNMEW